MKFNIKAGAAIAAAATMIAVPAAALAGPPSGHGKGNSGKSQSHVCKVHYRGYVEGGTISAVASDLSSITINVTHENHAAKLNPTTSVMLSNVKVRYDGGTTALTMGERVQVIGKVSFEAKKCTSDTSFTPTVTVRMIVVHPAATSAS
ncbi:MAG TPA: hypothetical protein VFN65_11000 [Solirubrobacteraceae bacterium]|nr:hypothetical protein [Solirubrobacteraceae bacterium]